MKRHRGERAIMVVLVLVLALVRPAGADDSGGAAALEDPITVAPSAYVAGIFYSGHPFRDRGAEAQARLDVSRGLSWSAHAAYTLDVFAETIELAARSGRPATAGETAQFHDVLGGGSLAPRADWPLWVGAEAHALFGRGDYAAGYASGGALFCYAGYGLGDFRVEAGGGAILLESDRGETALLRPSWRAAPWLDASLLALVTENAPEDPALGDGRWRFAWGAEARLGPFGRLSAELRWLGGERVLALDKLGAVAENTPDLLRDTFSGLLSFSVSERASLYLGASARLGEAPEGDEYVLGSAFAGGGIWF